MDCKYMDYSHKICDIEREVNMIFMLQISKSKGRSDLFTQ